MPVMLIGGPRHLADHAEKLTDLPDDQMKDILPIAKRLAKATVSFLRSARSIRVLMRSLAGRREL